MLLDNQPAWDVTLQVTLLCSNLCKRNSHTVRELMTIGAEMNPEDVHKIFGGVVLLLTILLLLAEAGLLRGAWVRYVLPTGLILFGVFLFLDPIIFHGGSFGGEGAQHQIQGALAASVGFVELARVRGHLRARAFGAFLPLLLLAVGIIFTVHSQHGGGDMRLQLVQHRLLGGTVIAAGLVLGAERLGLARGNWARVGWLLILLLVCLELFLYVEGSSGAAMDHGMNPAMEHSMDHSSP